MEQKPRISIITPSFNQGIFLEECIISVLEQDYPALEYIIMDGGSTDDSVVIIQKYEKYLSYWQSKPDGGQFAALNEGFRRSSGQIMAWINSDDKYHPDAFKKIADYFLEHAEHEWVVGRPTVWGYDGRLLRVYRGQLPDYSRENHLHREYLGVAIQQESTFWRRSLWERAGAKIDTTLKFAGDLELWNRFYRYAPLHTIDAFIGGFRIHGNQKSIKNFDAYIAEAEKIIKQEIKSGFSIAGCRESKNNQQSLPLTKMRITILKKVCVKDDRVQTVFIERFLSFIRMMRFLLVKFLINIHQVKLVAKLYYLRNCYLYRN